MVEGCGNLVDDLGDVERSLLLEEIFEGLGMVLVDEGDIVGVHFDVEDLVE